MRFFFRPPLDLDENNVDASNIFVDLLTSVLWSEHSMVNSSQDHNIWHTSYLALFKEKPMKVQELQSKTVVSLGMLCMTNSLQAKV
jgi:hypothetical protein